MRHSYLGPQNSRAQRMASKFTRAVPPITLDRLEELLAATRKRKKGTMSKTTPATPTTAPTLVDPWGEVVAAQPSARTDDPHSAPAEWWRLRAATRARIAGACIAILEQHPERSAPSDLHFLAHRAWTAARQEPAVEADLRRHPEIANALVVFEEVLRKLRGAGSVLALLDLRLAALQAERDKVAARVGLPTSDRNGTSAR